MTSVIANAAAAAFIFPVALSVANKLGVGFMPFAMVLVVGASCAFINPDGFQTNLMVMKPGGYRFRDFGRLGIPLVPLLVVIVAAPLVYGL